MTDLVDLPAGTVTFLFTDLEGSTALLEAHPRAYGAAVRRHHALLRGAVEAHGGTVFETVGDAVYAAFAHPSAAVAAALAGQLALQAEAWGEIGELRARVALHTGEVEVQGGHYFGAPLYRAGRLLPAVHGGQVVLSAATAELARSALPEEAELRDLGAHRLKDLQRPERLLQLLHPDLPGEFPPLGTLDARPHNLPVQPTPFVGREREVAAVRERLLRDDVRLLTLTGPGGVGKTRLALQAAADLLDAFPDGVWLVGLAPVADPNLVTAAVAAALGVREDAGRPLMPSLQDYLRGKRLLLVLDNCEHLLGAAPVVAELLAAAPGLRALVTSRAVLRLAAEHVFPVPPLTLPDSAPAPAPERVLESGAGRLFVERARAARPDFAVTAENALAVAALCRRLDGLPLALELAAARVRHLPPAALLARLERRLPLLTGGARDAPSHHQTLRAALAWSYDLLAPAERALFRRLGVFAGGCTLEAAEAVCGVAGAGEAGEDGGVLAGLAALVDQSLLRQEEAASPEEAAATDGEPRFGMLETVREYALERLDASDEAAALRDCHAAHYLALAERAAPELQGPRQAAWLARLEREHDNLRAALRWWVARERRGTPGATERGLRLAGALWRFWDIRGHYAEGRQELSELLALADPSRPAATPAAARGAAVLGAGTLAQRQGDYAAARVLAEEALAVARASGDRRAAAAVLTGLGHAVQNEGDYAAARARLEEALAVARALGDRQATAAALHRLGDLTVFREDYAAGRALLEEALALFRALGNQVGAGGALTGLGEAARQAGDHAAARTLLEEALALERAVGHKLEAAWTVHDLGCVLLAQGDGAAARARLEEALAGFRELGDRRATAWTLHDLSYAAHRRGDPAAARALAEEALALAGATGDRRLVAHAQAALGFAAYALGDAGAAEALSAAAQAALRDLDDPGRQWALLTLGRLAQDRGDPCTARARFDEARAVNQQAGRRAELGWSLLHLGELALDQGDHGAARAFLTESLALQAARGEPARLAAVLEAVAGLAAAEGRPARALRLAGAAAALQERIGAAPDPPRRARLERQLAPARHTLGGAAAAAAWAEGRATPLAPAVADALEEPAAVGGPAERAALGERSGPAPPLPAGLTAREAEVLRLVAQGLSDREVAARLVVSPRTVHAHLAAVYGKLGVSSRTQATRWALEHGLT